MNEKEPPVLITRTGGSRGTTLFGRQSADPLHLVAYVCHDRDLLPMAR